MCAGGRGIGGTAASSRARTQRARSRLRGASRGRVAGRASAPGATTSQHYRPLRDGYDSRTCRIAWIMVMGVDVGKRANMRSR